jgi:uncharacterized membrane protein
MQHAIAAGLTAHAAHHLHPVPPARQRLEWIDLFRGLAVIGMIETHAGNTFLDASLQKTGAWPEITYYNGLIAPAFFWILGYVRGLAFHKSPAPKPAWLSVKRLLMILAVGYAMHMPFGLLSHGNFSEPALWSMFMVDVLQCLAVSGLMLVLFERIPKLTNLAVALAFVFLVVFSDRAQTWRTGFIPLDAYLTSEHGSLFPLFPWAAFALAGFITSKAGITNARMFIISIALAFGIRHIPGFDWSIGFFLERLGWVMLLAFITSTVLERICQRARPATGWLYLAGRESLIVYVMHLTLIHALPWPAMSPEKQIGATQPPWIVALLFVGLLLLSIGAAAFNEWRKRRTSH